MEKVLITGVSGFIGRHCLQPLAGRAAAVHVVARRANSLPPLAPLGRGVGGAGGRTPGRIRVHRADLLDPAAVSALLAEVRPTHLLHLAWVTTPATYWTAPENLTWVAAGLHLVRTFAELGGRRVVVAGSCAEHDWRAGRP